jgi:hypothetical protein
MVQDYYANLRFPFGNKVGDGLYEEDKPIIRRLLDQMNEVFCRTGLCFFENLMDNLAFTQDGKLLLVDTNNILRFDALPIGSRKIIRDQMNQVTERVGAYRFNLSAR